MYVHTTGRQNETEKKKINYLYVPKHQQGRQAIASSDKRHNKEICNGCELVGFKILTNFDPFNFLGRLGYN
jgi:hypothetical protein